jgi:ribosomal protein S27AE
MKILSLFIFCLVACAVSCRKLPSVDNGQTCPRCGGTLIDSAKHDHEFCPKCHYARYFEEFKLITSN